MEIQNLKINQYGKLENKEINLKKFNIIHGKNESGKSTLLNFMLSMFYGISKTKDGKKYSDYERYNPWNKQDFSGTINYKLDNGKSYHVFRNFDKKSPVIYDENNNDISSEFDKDKKSGSQFFLEQTNIQKEILSSTVMAGQNETQIDVNIQNKLLQKIANLSESGDEENSYKGAITKLDKMYLDEIGTERSKQKPINIVTENIQNLQAKIKEIEGYKNYKYEYENKKSKLEEDLETEKENQKLLQERKNTIEENNLEQEKAKVKEKIVSENNKKINITILAIIIVLAIASIFIFKNIIITLCFIPVILFFSIYMIIKNKKQKGQHESKTEGLSSTEIYKKIEQNNNKINTLTLELHKLEIDQNTLEPKLDELINYEEKLALEQEKLKELEEKAKIFSITKNILENSYEEMKKNVTPKFNENLSKNIEKISNKNYNNIILGDEIRAELTNGEYIPIDKLSIGTIEQIYLSMRLSVIDELSNETLPIILDETFAYYDDERLKETLEYLSTLNNQVILLTCTNREQELLNKINIEFNNIEFNNIEL